MFVLVLVTIIILALSTLAVLGLIGFVIRVALDFLVYSVEVVAYAMQCVLKVLVRGAVAVIEAVDDWIGDGSITEEPLLRAPVMGIVGLICGVILVQLLAMVLNQPWVIITFACTVVGGLVLGLIADPDSDWSVGPFPSFERPRGGPKLPLNL